MIKHILKTKRYPKVKLKLKIKISIPLDDKLK